MADQAARDAQDVHDHLVVCPYCGSYDAADNNHEPDCHYDCDHTEALLVDALRTVLENPMGGYERSEAYARARSYGWSVLRLIDGGGAQSEGGPADA